MTIFDTLYNERRIYETPETPPDVWHARLTSAQAGQLLNRVAWQHCADGIGLLAKSTGNHTEQPVTLTSVAADILTDSRRGVHFDVLIDGPDSTVGYAGHAVPSFADKGPFDPARFIAPVEPPEVSLPPRPLPPLELPAPPPPLTPDLAALLPRLDALAAAVAAVHDASLSTARQLDALTAVLEAIHAAQAKGLDGALPWLGTVKLRPPKA